MPSNQSTSARPITGAGSVPADYSHYPKTVAAQADLILPGCHLKWYDLHRAGVPIPDRISVEAREFLAAEQESGRLRFDDELGFVVHHLCGEEFFFLIVNTWRNANELWETVYYKDGLDFPGHELADRDAAHKPTFCVWELGAVQHEQQAWQRFLRSDRDAVALDAFLADRFEGQV